MQCYDWSTVEKEQLSPQFARQVIYAEALTVARVYLKKGCVVPEHHHPNEQLSMLEEGELLFVVGGETVTAKAGETVHIPCGVPHSVTALTDSVSLDIFSGVREDWRSGNDAYLRR